MSIYERYARDLSESLYDSVYNDLYALAEKDQKSHWESCQKKKTKRARRESYGITESQQMLNEFCLGIVSLGNALDYIAVNKSRLGKHENL